MRDVDIFKAGQSLTNNINAVLATATPEDWAEGMEWYRVAHTFALGLAEENDTDVATAAGVLASISPRLNWGLNQAYAERMFRDGDAPILGLSKGKTLRILGGENPSVVFAPPEGSPRSGQKVRAFYECILRPEDTDAVCIDGHAYDIATGLGSASETERKKLVRVGVYEEIADAYRAVARERGIRPWQAQAVAWVAWRRQRGMKDHESRD
jgi:hypothetical protein